MVELDGLRDNDAGRDFGYLSDMMSHLAPAQDVKSSPALDIHVRLDHLAFSTMRKLMKSGHLSSVPGLMENKPGCDSCEATKATRRPFNDSQLPATAAGEIAVG
ncbi:hypothetical protein CF326_g8003 [Tilletia indica]|nr:hypothetical protein CF326_g8003 [Tilletia indica]